MADRVEKISPSKRVTYDVGNYGQKNGHADQNGSPFFAKQMQNKMEKESDQEKDTVKPSEPYVVNLSRATQSLFYEDGSAVKELLKEIHEP